MFKPDALRKALEAAVPALGADGDGDRLQMFIAGGRLESRFGETNLSFRYAYQLRLVLLDFSGHPDTVFIAILAWIGVHQPDLLLNADRLQSGLAFEAELLDREKVDLQIELALTEDVRVFRNPDGTYAVNHIGEPPLELPGAAALLKELYANDELLLPALVHPPASDG